MYTQRKTWLKVSIIVAFFPYVSSLSMYKGYFSPTYTSASYHLWIIISGAHIQKLYNYGERKRLNPTIILYQEDVRGNENTINVRFSLGIWHNHMQSNIFRVDLLKNNPSKIICKKSHILIRSEELFLLILLIRRLNHHKIKTGEFTGIYDLKRFQLVI